MTIPFHDATYVIHFVVLFKRKAAISIYSLTLTIVYVTFCKGNVTIPIHCVTMLKNNVTFRKQRVTLFKANVKE